MSSDNLHAIEQELRDADAQIKRLHRDQDRVWKRYHEAERRSHILYRRLRTYEPKHIIDEALE